MKILILNSDLAKNRGDRAIAEGLIQLIVDHFDDAHIQGLSEAASRDTDWFGIDFLDMDANSINPLQWLRLAWYTRRADLVLWGGGEILKDYTNKLALWYWSIKIAWLRLFNRNIVGAYQGIGPTYGSLSRRLVTFAVNRTRRFAVRDTESMEKLVAWGVPAEKLIAATDPAIMASGVSGTPTNPISDDILDDFIAIAPRDWFHYETGGVVPHRFQSQKPSAENARYIEHLVQLIEYASQQTGHIVLVPMHMHQDVDFCRSLAERVSADVPVTVLADDHIRPRQLRTLLARAKCMIGFRLHATIIATAAGVPSVNFYYVDKGRVYFDQIDMAEFAFPIEALLEPQQGGAIQAAIRAVIDDRASVKNTLAARLDSLREELKASFRNLCE